MILGGLLSMVALSLESKMEALRMRRGVMGD